MNTIGIDYQHTLSVICLREGTCSIAKIRSVGDGRNHLIPNVGLDNELWGSRAFEKADSKRLRDAFRLNDDLWFDEEIASLFWQGVYRRLYTYLGRTEPTMPNGYRIVVSTQAENYPAAAEQIFRFCIGARLSDTTIISSVDAILCRWLTEQKADKSGECAVAVVAVGDTSISVRAYRIQHQNHHFPRILCGSQTLSLTHKVGQAWWVNNVLKLVEEHMNGQLPVGQELALRNAAIELGTQLSRVRPYEPAIWVGPFQSHLFEPLQLTRHDCASWDGIMQMTYDLPALIQEVVLSATNSKKPDLLLLGGVGAVWPFTIDAVAPYIDPKNIWQSSTPQEDTACGAACFPEVGEPYIDILQRHTEAVAEERIAGLVPEQPLDDTNSDKGVTSTPFPNEVIRDTPFQQSLTPPDEVSLNQDLQPDLLLSGSSSTDLHHALQPNLLLSSEEASDPAPGALLSAGTTLDPRLQPDPLFSVADEFKPDQELQPDL